MSDGLPDPADQRERFGEWQREAGVSTVRFIDVHDGEKRSTDHTQRAPDDDALQGNYGVYGGPGDDDVEADPEKVDIDNPAAVDVRWLVDMDVDDYENADNGSVSTEGIDSLPDTFTIESPHTDGENGGHRYYVVKGHVAAAIYDRYGVKNPSPGWGEIRVYNQYCVGPGSQLDDCSKEWCDQCDDPDGGYYRIADDREIATLGLDTFIEVVATDYEAGGDGSSDSTLQGSDNTIVTQGDLGEYEPDPDADATDVVGNHNWMQQYLAGLEKDPDRSEKDFAMCRTFIEAGVAETDAWDLLENSGASKVGADDASANYWSSTWNRARLAHEQEQANNGKPNETDDDGRTSWQYVRYEYAESGKKRGRAFAAEALEDRTSWMYVREEDRLWYYDDSGTFNKWGEEIATGLLESGLGDEFSRTERNEIIARIEARNQVHRRELNGGEHPEPLVCVGNGVVDLETGTLLDHDPNYRFTRGLTGITTRRTPTPNPSGRSSTRSLADPRTATPSSTTSHTGSCPDTPTARS